MSNLHQDRRPISDLPIELNRVAVDLNAVIVIATDESGRLIDISAHNTTIDLQTLAVLAMANLASSMQLLSLTQTNSAGNDSLINLIEKEQMRLIVAGKQKPGGLIFVSLLGTHSPLGLARIEMQGLNDMNWDLPIQTMNEEWTLIDQHLDSHDLFGNLFDTAGGEKQ